MSYTTWKVEYVPFVDNSWDEGSRETLTSYYDMLYSQELGEGRDDFSFKVTNFNNEFDDYFKPNDKIEIYRIVNSDTVSTDPDFIGTVKDSPHEEDGTQDIIRVEGYNFSEALMSAIIFIDITGTPAEIIEEALDNAGENNNNFKVTWAASNPSTNSDGDSFPSYTEKSYNKTLKSVIEKYSTQQKTQDKNYYWYVNSENELIWKPETDSVDYTFDAATDTHKSLKIKKDIKGIKNYIILKGGHSPSGRQIQERYIAWASVAKHGQKYHFVVSESNTAKNLVDEDIRKSYGSDNVTETFPDLSTSFTTSWKSQAEAAFTTKQYGITVTPGSTVTINEGTELANKKAYDEVIIQEIKSRLIREGRDIAENLQYGKLSVDIAASPGTFSWGLGDNVSCDIPSIQAANKILRVREIQRSTDEDTYSLEEDIGTL